MATTLLAGPSTIQLRLSTGAAIAGTPTQLLTLMTASSDFNSLTDLKNAKLGSMVSVKDFGAIGDGSTDDTAFIQAAIDATATKHIHFPPGTYKVTAKILPKDGLRVSGDSMNGVILNKTDFVGAVFDVTDVDDLFFENFSMTGPGQFTGTSNKGFNLFITSNEILANLHFSNITITGMNDLGMFIGTGAFCHYDNIKFRDCGGGGLFIQGGDGHVLTAVTVKNVIAGITLETVSSVVANGCYVEQAGLGVLINNCKSVVLNGCGVEANIDRNAANPGRSYHIKDGTDITLNSCLSRQDTIGAAAEENAQHLLVDTNAERVVITNFNKVNSGSFPPTTEADVSGALDRVLFTRNNFDFAKLTKGKFYVELDAPPMCKLTKSAIQEIAKSVSEVILFETEDFDTDGMHSVSTNTGRITINTNGTYMVGYNTEWEDNFNGGRFATILKNGAGQTNRSKINASGTADHGVGEIFQLVATDYLELQVFHDSTTDPLDITARCVFWAYRIGN